MAMKLPNGYGSIVKLSGKRRKPFAVRITTGYDLDMDAVRVTQKYKYLEYFEKRADAMTFLAQYNAGLAVKEHTSIMDVPTFAEIYALWMQELESRKRGLGASMRRSLNSAFNKLERLHDRRITSIRYVDAQNVLDGFRNMSKSSTSNMVMVFHGVAQYAVKYEYITSDFSANLRSEGCDPKGIHKPFTKEEIRMLWSDADNYVAQYALITIYTGMRPSEVLAIRPDPEHLERHYMVGGLKTAAGRNRIIPLHRDIEPIIRRFYAKGSTACRFHDTGNFRVTHWNPYMMAHGLDHKPHDGRHTCATLMEAAGVPLNRRKLILGHAVSDITDGVYTHVEPSELVAEINKIEV